MKILFQNEFELNERIAEFNSDKTYNSRYLSRKPESYPCICVINTDYTLAGDHIIEIIDFIYSSDFPWSHL